jgi:hypothetical protein
MTTNRLFWHNLNFILMKISLSIAILSISVSYGQINQKTIELRKHYGHPSTFQVKTLQPFLSPTTYISYHIADKASTNLATVRQSKPSTFSIQKAFDYYNNQKKQPDLSGFVMMGHSAFSKQPFSYNSQPAESLRFFPANGKD